MRTDKELVQVLLDNLDEYFYIGICYLIVRLETTDIINSNEYAILISIIKGNIDDYPLSDHIGHFYWEPFEIEPRRKYLEYLLTIV